ncbi:MAG: prepilin-type N-terminal cleavage/methylation domain-containing protein [Pseudomonadota bacterium]|nr:prepilin-type N-terminal cleavage/methylation domain-containing protein [Pseudomonadota bacterium]
MITSQRGFTLVEAIMVIVIIGVVGGMVAVFIRAPVQGYADSVARAELSDTADLALRRMARDLRLALPNSIRVSGNSLEMLATRSGGRYLAADDSVDTLPVLDFIDPANTSFTVVGAMPGAGELVTGSDYLVVNNLGEGYAPANAYDLASAQRNIALIAGADATRKTLTLADNPFAVQAPPAPSASQRYQIVSGPVTYYCGLEADGVTRMLTRQSGYAITSAQVANPVPAVGAARGQRSLMAGRVASCEFHYEKLASQRSALVILALELQARGGTGGSVRLVHQVHVDNTP